MSAVRLIVLTALAMTAFAGNSLLCRAALKHTSIDAASFTSVRLLSGALMLWLIVQVRKDTAAGKGSWRSALALFAYAAAFSYAYSSLPTATGALLLFGTVQTSLIVHGLYAGERLHGVQIAGFVLAVGGLVGLLLPGLSAPPLFGALLMIIAGIAWGIYTVRGKGAGDPTHVTAGNFLRTVPLAAMLSMLMYRNFSFDAAGMGYAIVSGALSSGVGYAIWYAVLPSLKSTRAAAVQLGVPVIAALGGVVLLGEPLTQRLEMSSAAILGGVALVILERYQMQKGAG